MADGEGCAAKWAATMCPTELVTFDGVLLTGIAGGRGGGAGCNNAGLYTAGDGEKSGREDALDQ